MYRFDLTNEAVKLFPAGDIEPVGRDSAVGRGGERRGLGKPFTVEIGQREASAPPGKLDGEGASDAGSRSGYHRDRLTIDFHISSGFSVFSGFICSGSLPAQQ